MSVRLQHAEPAMDAFQSAGCEPAGLSIPARLIAETVSQSALERTDSDREQPTIAETIDYIQTLAQELRRIAQQAGLTRLALILTLAEQEAHQVSKRDR